jgi:ElaA protein
MELRWHDKPFAALAVGELYAILALRQRVFVVEQTCPYQDADGVDPVARHRWAAAGGEVVAYLRIIPPGVTFDELSIGRVVTAPTARGQGLGRQLMRRGIDAVIASHGPVPIRIGAQAHLEDFYGELGFVRTSEVYLEDDIPHVEMLYAPA